VFWFTCPVVAGGVPAEPEENGLEHRTQAADAFRADDEVPERLEALPAARVRDVPDRVDRRSMCRGAAQDRPPPVELTVVLGR